MGCALENGGVLFLSFTPTLLFTPYLKQTGILGRVRRGNTMKFPDWFHSNGVRCSQILYLSSSTALSSSNTATWNYSLISKGAALKMSPKCAQSIHNSKNVPSESYTIIIAYHTVYHTIYRLIAKCGILICKDQHIS